MDTVSKMRKAQSEAGRSSLPRVPASRPAGYSEQWRKGISFSRFWKRVPLVAQSAELISGAGDRTKDVKAKPSLAEQTNVKTVEKEVFYDASDEVIEDAYYDAQEFLDKTTELRSSPGQRRLSLNHVPSMSDYISLKPHEKLASIVPIKKGSEAQGDVLASLVQRRKEMKKVDKASSGLYKELLRLEKKNAKVLRKHKRVMDKVKWTQVQLRVPIAGKRHDHVRVPKTVVGTDKEMAAGDDVTVMETVSTSSVGSQDAVSGMSVSAREKNAAMPTAAMSDLSYVLRPEDLEKKGKESDVDGESAVVDVADVAASDDIPVMETVSTSLLCAKDAESGLSVDAAKLATPAMSDLSYVIYQGPEDLEKKEKESDVAGEPAVVDVADVAAGDDIAVKETVSTSLVYPKDAVSGLYVDAAKLATPAMSDLSYVIYEGPENLEKNKKDSDVAREPAVVDVADVAAGDDIAVKETVSTSLVYPKDAVSGLYVDAAKLATPAMSDLSYVIYEGPENLEKNKKDSDVAREFAVVDAEKDAAAGDDITAMETRTVSTSLVHSEDAVSGLSVAAEKLATPAVSDLSYIIYEGPDELEKKEMEGDIAWDVGMGVADDANTWMETASTRSLCSLDAISNMTDASCVAEERTAADAACMLAVATSKTGHSSELGVAMEATAVTDKQQAELLLLERTLEGGLDISGLDNTEPAQGGAEKKHGKYCRAKKWVRSKLRKGWRSLTRRAG
ncbi:uncharacterized protein LOC118428166 isoform X1 [Branchiostoma floridae]|uniref:Uncharacterized protein LOC118428166 isoform X1 n=1 Tax=Branchiostoma floridae TaxID=7739 RepID=A0A9J7N963_BRAFL|nr:uncharacterized protein LOC118428166 isoform X1 [Branchiostoma floridae]XP_035694051.1 uncharacterized protein LOC118428166 isoform X1 [Branchiostoma floridae]